MARASRRAQPRRPRMPAAIRRARSTHESPDRSANECAARSPANYYDLAFTGKHVFWNQWTAGTDRSTVSIRTASLNSPADREVASVSFGYGSEVAIPKSANDGRLVYYGGSEFGECRVEMLIPPARRPRHLFVLDRPPTLLALSANRIAVVFADRRTIQIRATGDGRRISRMTTSTPVRAIGLSGRTLATQLVAAKGAAHGSRSSTR